jgi:hypothetical protein
MELYHGGGGAQNPRFTYTVLVSDTNTEMYEWLQNHPGLSCFDRFYINWQGNRADGKIEIQFERHEPAVLFKLRWGGD